jgi:alanine-alpha-ketoisovalerate/valine-pyruvate aminotransferase
MERERQTSGASIAANVLRSDQAVRMSVYVIRAFVRLREALAANAAILKRLAENAWRLADGGWRKIQGLGTRG